MGARKKLLVWIGSSKKDLMALPIAVRKFFGHALDYAERGERHDAARILKGFGDAAVLELVEDDADADGTYRAVYTVRFTEAVFVLHCFQKKKEQSRNFHTESGYGHHLRAFEDCRTIGAGTE